mgnify:CR=1 FL=1|tara:strand:+ start:694 stop:942 length:249 start_codon:yes stop_codon:yes gene_type:complete
MKNSIVKWLVFLRFFFPELDRSSKILFILQFIFFIGSIVLAVIHVELAIEKPEMIRVVIYNLCTTVVFWMGMNYIKNAAFKI